MTPRATLPPALGHNTRDTKAYALFLVSGLLLATYPGALIGASIAYMVWRFTRTDTLTRWLVAGISACAAATFQPSLGLVWSWGLVAHAIFPADTTAVAPASILPSLPSEMVLGPLILLSIQLGVAYRRTTIHGEEWTRYQQMQSRKRALERGWAGPGASTTTPQQETAPSDG